MSKLASAKQKRATKVPIVSLFCGAGGLDEGFRQAGFYPVLAVDKEHSACATYEQNHPSTVLILETDLLKEKDSFVVDEIKKLNNGTPVGLIGGPPCQAFSKGNSFRNPHDRRAVLIRKYAKLIKSLNRRKKIEFFVFENVEGLLWKKQKNKLKLFLKELQDAGFLVFKCRLNAAEYGVAQNRARVFFVGFNKKIFPDIKFEPPEPTHLVPKTVRQVLKGLKPPTIFELGLKRAKTPLHPNHWCMAPKSDKFKNNFLLTSKLEGRSFRVIDLDKPSPTVAYGNREVSIHPSGTRRLSVLEAMLLQGFPKKYRLMGNLSQQIRLISDAVPPPLAKALARKIRETIENYRCSAQQKHACNTIKRQHLNGASIQKASPALEDLRLAKSS